MAGVIVFGAFLVLAVHALYCNLSALVHHILSRHKVLLVVLEKDQCNKGVPTAQMCADTMRSKLSVTLGVLLQHVQHTCSQCVDNNKGLHQQLLAIPAPLIVEPRIRCWCTVDV
jgi:hypothetical protein